MVEIHYEIYNVVMISTDASRDGDGVIAGDDGGCFNTPGFPIESFRMISIFVNADDTQYRFSLRILCDSSISDSERDAMNASE